MRRRNRTDDTVLWAACLALGLFLLAFAWFVLIR